MNASERLALAYLHGLALGPVEFEPVGNIPPDLVVGGRIAVEVRRLNQNHVQADGTAQGLEELSLALMARIDALCTRLGAGCARPQPATVHRREADQDRAPPASILDVVVGA